MVVVVSAMGDTTDELLALARQVCESPARRELDMLLSAGERISMALLSMAINARGVPAVSFTGSQSGIVTNDAHTNARIVEVRPYRVQDELARGRVVIVAGYQGVSYKSEVTTLGRGGSDTTAVALAAALDAEAARSTATSTASTPPTRASSRRRGASPSSRYEEMQELAEAGAKVLERAGRRVREGARDRDLRARHPRRRRDGRAPLPAARCPAAWWASRASRGSSLVDDARTSRAAAARSALARRCSTSGRPRASSCCSRSGAAHGGFASLVLSLENLHDFAALRRDLAARFGARVQLREGVGAVSAIGAGINASFANVRRALRARSRASGAVPLGISTSGFRISLLLEEEPSARGRARAAPRAGHRGRPGR